MQSYAAASTKEEGEFYTPPSLVKLIAELLEPYSGRVYDSVCRFRVIIMTVANSFRKSRVSDSLPKVETRRFNNLSIA